MAWLQVAMAAAPLVASGIGAIKGIFQSRKAKKGMKAQQAHIQAQLAQMAQQTQGLQAKVMGNFMGPSGINAGMNGVPQMGQGQLPPFV